MLRQNARVLKMFEGYHQIVSKQSLTPKTQLGIFRVDKDKIQESELEKWLSNDEVKHLNSFKSEFRKIQRMSSLALVSKTLGRTGNIMHATSGKPYLKGNKQFISISHCQDLICYVIHDQEVGLDIHHFNPKTKIIAKKFLNDAEIAFCEQRGGHFMDLFWALKESVFKIYGSDLAFKDIEINLNTITDDKIDCLIKGKNEHIVVTYELHEKFCLCLASRVN